jgi:hypothetical protein
LHDRDNLLASLEERLQFLCAHVFAILAGLFIELSWAVVGVGGRERGAPSLIVREVKVRSGEARREQERICTEGFREGRGERKGESEGESILEFSKINRLILIRNLNMNFDIKKIIIIKLESLIFN